MEKDLNRDVYREFFVKEETCMQCKGNGYVVVAIECRSVARGL